MKSQCRDGRSGLVQVLSVVCGASRCWRRIASLLQHSGLGFDLKDLVRRHLFLWQLQLSLFLTENFKQYDILAPLMFLSFDLPWMEYNPNHLVQLSKELFPGDGG